MDTKRQHRGLSPIGIALALLSAAGIAAALTLLYQGMGFIMRTEGGFVAAGGPYEIVHPAPDWVWLIPLSIWAGVLFAGLHLFASFRGWGVNLIAVIWGALFVSLGWNFLRFGLHSPFGGGIEWGWLISGVVFWTMGFVPIIAVARWVRAGWRQIAERQPILPGMQPFGIPAADTHVAYVAAQVAGAIGGLAGGIALFRAIAGG
jgi:hypothetical protein